MFGLWYTHGKYRGMYGRSVLDDLVSGQLKSFPYFSSWLTPSQKIGACASRYMRMHGLTTVHEWNSVIDACLRKRGGGPGSNQIYGALAIGPQLFPVRSTRAVEFEDRIGRQYTRAKLKVNSAAYTRFLNLREERVRRAAYQEAKQKLLWRTCSCCGVISEQQSAKTVTWRNVQPPAQWSYRRVYVEFAWTFYKSILCVSCWKKEKRKWKRIQEAADIETLNNKLKRAISEQANQNNRRDQTVSV